MDFSDVQFMFYAVRIWKAVVVVLLLVAVQAPWGELRADCCCSPMVAGKPWSYDEPL